MIDPDYTYFGSLEYLATECNSPDFTKGEGWYQLEYLEGSKKFFDCCLLTKVPKGSARKQEYYLRIYQNHTIQEIKDILIGATKLEIREIL